LLIAHKLRAVARRERRATIGREVATEPEEERAGERTREADHEKREERTQRRAIG